MTKTMISNPAGVLRWQTWRMFCPLCDQFGEKVDSEALANTDARIHNRTMHPGWKPADRMSENSP